jgi:hypothetical protein
MKDIDFIFYACPLFGEAIRYCHDINYHSEIDCAIFTPNNI